MYMSPWIYSWALSNIYPPYYPNKSTKTKVLQENWGLDLRSIKMETNLISPEPETRAALRLASQVIFSCLQCHIFSGVIYFLWLITVHQVVSSLPLQMTLYFNLIYFPCWLAVGIIILFTVTSYKAKHYEPLNSLTNWECCAKSRWSWWWPQWSSLSWTISTSLFSSLS